MKTKRMIIAAIALGAIIPGLLVRAQTRKPATKKRTTTTTRTAAKPTTTKASDPKMTDTNMAPAAVPSAATTTPSGLTYIITHRGEGRQPQSGETVTVHYTGVLWNGVKFDSSRDRGQPFEFPLGQGRVIKGWDEGIAKLRIGDQATFIIPASLGYGDRGAGGVIPPGATLIFIVELVGIK